MSGAIEETLPVLGRLGATNGNCQADVYSPPDATCHTRRYGRMARGQLCGIRPAQTSNE